MRYLFFIMITILFFSCREESKNEIAELNLEQIYGTDSWEEVSSRPNKVFYFLAPECPLCQNYAVAMRELYEKYPEVEFIGIFPGREYSREEIKKYLIRFKLEMNCFYDPEFKLTEMMGAEITPEAFLLDENDEVVYSGAINNWAISLGQKRTVITENYLNDAILAVQNKSEIKTRKSKAVGCFIQ